MLLFSIFQVLFSHQHVQMITGPHEKSGVENFFGDPFLTKSTFSIQFPQAAYGSIILKLGFIIIS